jgi:hypothetical protein
MISTSLVAGGFYHMRASAVSYRPSRINSSSELSLCNLALVNKLTNCVEATRIVGSIAGDQSHLGRTFATEGEPVD